MSLRRRIARMLDPGHYIVAERKAKIVDKVFQLQADMIADKDYLHPEARAIVNWLTIAEPDQ